MKKIKKVKTTHEGQIIYLKKIEGQVRGVQKMIAEGRYCVDILTQLHSVIGALKRVESGVFRKHLEGCVVGAVTGGSEADARKKVDEVVTLLDRFKKA